MTLRDVLAALLLARGYTHDDENDPYDLHWYGPQLGVPPAAGLRGVRDQRREGGTDAGLGHVRGFGRTVTEKAIKLTRKRWDAHLSGTKRLSPGRYYVDHKNGDRDTITIGATKVSTHAE